MIPHPDLPINGTPLKYKPLSVTKCDLSIATFAQHRLTGQWYDLTAHKRALDLSYNFAFYKRGLKQKSHIQSLSTPSKLSEI